MAKEVTEEKRIIDEAKAAAVASGAGVAMLAMKYPDQLMFGLQILIVAELRNIRVLTAQGVLQAQAHRGTAEDT